MSYKSATENVCNIVLSCITLTLALHNRGYVETRISTYIHIHLCEYCSEWLGAFNLQPPRVPRTRRRFCPPCSCGRLSPPLSALVSSPCSFIPSSLPMFKA